MSKACYIGEAAIKAEESNGRIYELRGPGSELFEGVRMTLPEAEEAASIVNARGGRRDCLRCKATYPLSDYLRTKQDLCGDCYAQVNLLSRMKANLLSARPVREMSAEERERVSKLMEESYRGVQQLLPLLIPLAPEAERPYLTEQTWAAFQRSGLLWWINRTLHLFGWAIVLEYQDGTVNRAYPARCRYRGFSLDDDKAGFQALTSHLAGIAAELKQDCQD